MNKMKGEIIIGAAIVAFMYGVFASVIIPSAYYDANKADNCPEYIQDTTKSQRKACYAEKKANSVGMTIVDE